MIEKRSRSVLVAAVLVMVEVTSAQAQLSVVAPASGQPGEQPPVPANGFLVDQTNACDLGVASQQFPDVTNLRLQAADDFVVPPGELWRIRRVVAPGIFSLTGPFNSVSVEIYNADGTGGLPGTLACSDTGLASANGGSSPGLDVTLSGTCHLSAGVYWVSSFVVMNLTGSGQWFWNSNNSTNGSQFAFEDADGLVPVPACSSWGLGQTTCGLATPFPDLCFAIEGDRIGEPVPALSNISLLLLTLALVALAFVLLSRRRRARNASFSDA